MALKMSYCALRWQTPDLEIALAELKKAGWEGWEGRLPLDWLGPPERLRQVCTNAGMPMVVYTASGSPDQRDWAQVERNKRRMEYAAAVGVDCFMFMNAGKPEGRPVSAGDLEAAAEGAEQWAEYAAQFGLELSYHIHTNLLVDSAEDWKRYMGLLKKARLCIDVSHADLWGYDPVASIVDFWSQLNYIHLQDYSSTSRAADGTYLPVWCDVGQAASLDFAAILKTLDQRGFSRWVTSCPGEPIPGQEDPVSEARRSKRMREYLRGLGY
ncbi:MAG: sugar phosphate isomerase/epimerase [Candidatus Latescibacteria bacterium]|nr:sugar phosphate isomerase/epimerase [Candidatus Latescibacterota bacterium]